MATSRARTSRSNTAGQRVDIGRLPELAAELVRRRVTVIAGIHPACGAGGQGGDHDDPDRLHRAAPIRSSSALLPASTGRAAMLRVQLFSPQSWRRSDWSCCTNWSPTLLNIAVLVNPNFPEVDASRETSQAAARAIGLHAVNLAAPNTRAASTRPLRHCPNSGPTPSFVAADPFFY